MVPAVEQSTEFLVPFVEVEVMPEVLIAAVDVDEVKVVMSRKLCSNLLTIKIGLKVSTNGFLEKVS